MHENHASVKNRGVFLTRLLATRSERLWPATQRSTHPSPTISTTSPLGMKSPYKRLTGNRPDAIVFCGMARVGAKVSEAGLTQRQDLWWLQPLSILVGLGIFVVYSAVVTLLDPGFGSASGRDQFHHVGPYLSPFFSPNIPHLVPGDGSWWPVSPAILILWAPLGFRLTCYYYRKSYYRAFFWDPPACAVGEVLRKRYSGETRFPFIFQNLHRVFLYLAILVVGFLWYDAIIAFIWDGSFGLGIGTLVMVANCVFLSFYTFSCHSFRHVVGGCLDCLSARPARYRLWKWVSRLNVGHPTWAWTSLVLVVLADLYVRLVASGAISLSADRLI